MLPVLAYKYYKNQKAKNTREMEAALESITSNLSRSLILPDQISLKIPGVSAKLVDDGEDNHTTEEYIPGTLYIVEKPTGVFIEWSPCSEEDAGWVLAGEDDSGTTLSTSPPAGHSPVKAETVNRLRFSVDVNDLSSFKNIEPKKGKGHPCIRLICKDGTNYVPLYFLTQNTSHFIEVLQRYVTLRRSAREHQLVLVVDEKAEALAQSVSMLDQNGDIMTRFLQNPYATAMTGFGRISTFVQDQVIPSILDSEDAVSQEEKIRAMRELRGKEDGTRFRIVPDADFEVVDQLELPPRPDIFREAPVTFAVWKTFQKSDGTFDQQKLHPLMMNIFRGGIEPELRKEAWKYLLGYYDWFKTPAENAQERLRYEKEYERMKNQWKSISADQESRFNKYVIRKALVEKDVARTDRTLKFFQGDDNPNLVMLQNVLMTYCMYDFDLGYVQGMSDFCSPLLYVMQDEVDAFWCFVKVMQKMHGNFEKSQMAINTQLSQLRDLLLIINPKLANYLEAHEAEHMYFCFRWVIVWFKREFSFEDICKLWEVMWTGQPCKNFLLLCCAATLDRQTNVIIENKFGLTEILKHVNDLSMHHSLDEMLTSAEAIFHQLSASQDKLPTHICQIFLKDPEAPAPVV